MPEIQLIPINEFARVQHAPLTRHVQVALLADMCRANTLAMVKRAGSGHLGSSFSAMDLVAWLYWSEMQARDGQHDLYFSSKGHDVPGLYAVLYARGVLPRERYIRLRRFGGLDGHPDVHVPGIHANSGSLGMGISKGKGMAWAKQKQGDRGRVFVLTGDGEWQEGQNFEALQTAAQQKIGNLIVIVDHNAVQSDKRVDEIISLGALPEKFRAFGWRVARVGGHDLSAFENVLHALNEFPDQPKIIIADTIKGRGVSFMEHPVALAANHGLYPYHAGAPDDATFTRAYAELIERLNTRLDEMDLSQLLLETIPPETPTSSAPVMLLGEPVSQAAAERIQAKVSEEFVAQAYGKTLVALAPEIPNLVVLDADLASDCRVREFEKTFPERFIENGIAEQDMVSMAGGLARQGWLPVVNSFASFLAARANEQIYNNATEGSKIIYALHYAGLIPAGPGKSHQSIRDISLLGALPNMIIAQPCNADETRQLVEWSVRDASENVALRFAIGPSPRKLQLPQEYRVTFGQGARLHEGADAILFGYGPVMLHEALTAAELLTERGFGLRVVNMPWLNRVDAAWLERVIANCAQLFVIEDHAPIGGLGDTLLRALNTSTNLQARALHVFGVEGFPACGTPAEALKFHRLDGVSLAERIVAVCRGG